MDRVLYACTAIVGIGAALEVLRRLIRAAYRGTRGMIRTVRKLSRLADEILGVADDPDRPGWGARLATLEQRAETTDIRIAAVLAEVRPNGGSSMRDAVARIEQATGADKH